jgi:hypothetical protein
MKDEFKDYVKHFIHNHTLPDNETDYDKALVRKNKILRLKIRMETELLDALNNYIKKNPECRENYIELRMHIIDSVMIFLYS